MSEADPFHQPEFWEHLTAHQLDVCKQLKTHNFYVGMGIRDVEDNMPDLEVDALVSAVDFVNWRRTEQETIASLPPLGFYEPGLTTDTLLTRLVDELPFSDDEIDVLTETVLKWDEATGLWGDLSEEESGLIDRWRTWLRESWEGEGRDRPSESARRAMDIGDKIAACLAALLPDDPMSLD